MPSLPFQTFDVFTQEKFTGNPLAVLFDAQGLTTEQMQTITNEFNLSETTFVLPPENASHTARVRIFTLGYEMPFAGHPTVGTAIAIAKARGLSGSLTLELNAGLFPVEVDLSGEVAFARFTNPNIPDNVGDAPTVDALAAALGINSEDIDQDLHRPRLCGSGGVNFVYGCASLAAVRSANLNVTAFSKLNLEKTVGVYLYANGAVDHHEYADVAFHARMFAPDAGIPEDPATGSAAAGLPAQIALAEKLDDGTYHWLVEQGYEMERPSQIMVRVTVSGGHLNKVEIGGHAIPVMTGQIDL